MQHLKDALYSDPVLRRPDYAQPFRLMTDWSQAGVGAVLSQLDSKGQEFAVAYASRSCNAAEKNYCSYDGESLAVVWAAHHFRHYLIGTSFTLITDHQALKWMMTTSRLTRRLARWSLQLQEYDFIIEHSAGTDNPVADCFSRNPLASEEDPSREKRKDLGKICHQGRGEDTALSQEVKNCAYRTTAVRTTSKRS